MRGGFGCGGCEDCGPGFGPMACEECGDGFPPCVLDGLGRCPACVTLDCTLCKQDRPVAELDVVDFGALAGVPVCFRCIGELAAWCDERRAGAVDHLDARLPWELDADELPALEAG